ncbi:hypothetical protein J6590_027869 [Homalodisca vitripennis]|nr:hypothetical protein J6590_027869 [Homalodisca vitripennis]
MESWLELISERLNTPTILLGLGGGRVAGWGGENKPANFLLSAPGEYKINCPPGNDYPSFWLNLSATCATLTLTERSPTPPPAPIAGVDFSENSAVNDTIEPIDLMEAIYCDYALPPPHHKTRPGATPSCGGRLPPRARRKSIKGHRDITFDLDAMEVIWPVTIQLRKLAFLLRITYSGLYSTLVGPEKDTPHHLTGRGHGPSK